LKGEIMEKITEFLKGMVSTKPEAIGAIGIIGSITANLLGGWDMALRALMLFMATDYISGLIVAGVFKKSKKSETGKLESKAGFKGLCRKGMIIGIVFIAAQLDLLSGTDMIRNAVIIGYVVNEGVSIAENARLMGVTIPPIIDKALELLKKDGTKNAD